ncbi:hypothetical protein [uncultured Eubacterium sp.]|uniref:hypothetical protein n=1 Tax=uncultured Eubacterium sp. TaxID=165185 RepID=UPI002672B385|nr:hypothetical protein [uncultured Eubacterium sp.]
MDYRYIPFYVQGNAISGIYYGQWGAADDRDMDYVKEMYPLTFSRLQELVENECNRQEFAGSMMYDEYPDKLGILRMVGSIFDILKEEEAECVGEECTKYPDDNWLKDIITVLLLNEMYRRRQRRKRYY